LHDLTYIPARDEITVEDFEEGSTREVTLHDGSMIVLKKLEKDYDPTDKWNALRVLEEGSNQRVLTTGLIYVNPDIPSMFDIYDLVDTPLNRLTETNLRPPKETIDKLNALMF